MAKNQTVDKTVKIFSLSRFRVGCYYGTVSVDFTASQRPNNHFESIVPIFNKDKEYTTKAFILPNQQLYYSKNTQLEKEKFEERIIAAQERKSGHTVMNAMPSSSYCQICKQSYQHYQLHVNCKSHIRRLRSSKANKYINELLQKISRSEHHQGICQKTKPIAKKKYESKDKKLTNQTQIRDDQSPAQPTNCIKINNNSTNIVSELLGTN